MTHAFDPSLELERQIDSLCIEFEEAIHQGQQPRLETYFPRIDEQALKPLVRELLLVEVSHRLAHGEGADRCDYTDRLTGFEGVVDEVFQLLTAYNEAPLLEPGAAVGRYQIVEQLGRGAFGTVYRARDNELCRDVAIKVPKYEGTQTGFDRERQLREARAIAELRHPAIRQVHDVITLDNGTPAIVLEYIDGLSLQEHLASGGANRQRCLTWLATICDALGHAHQQGFVHCDLNPRNVILDGEARPLIVDFGLAVQTYGAADTRDRLSGSLPWMAPEQVRGEPCWLDGRCDIWAVGVMLYQVLTGRRPFDGDTPAEIVAQILARDPIPPRQVDPSVSPALEQICNKCLAKPLEKRYAAAKDVATDLRAAMAPDAKANQRGRRGAIAAALAAPVLLVAGWLALTWPTVPAANPLPSEPPPLSATLDVGVFNEHDASRQAVSIRQAWPLQEGDTYWLDVALDQPAFVYVLAISVDGSLSPLFPWEDESYEQRPSQEKPTRKLVLPKQDGDVFKAAQGPPGQRCFVVLLRRSPLPTDIHVGELVGTLRPQPGKQAPLYFRDGVLSVGPSRAGDFATTTNLPLPVADNLRQLNSALATHFDTSFAISFPFAGQGSELRRAEQLLQQERFTEAGEVLAKLRATLTEPHDSTAGPDSHELIQCLTMLGSCLDADGNFSESESCFREALRRAGHTTDPSGECASPPCAKALRGLATVLHESDRQQAIAYLRQAIRFHSAQGDDSETVEHVTCIKTLGSLLAVERDISKAMALYGQADDLCSRRFDKHPTQELRELWTDVNLELGLQWFHMGDIAKALQRAERAESLLRDGPSPSLPASLRSFGRTHNLIGLCHLGAQRLEEAKEHFQSACDFYERCPDPLREDLPATLANFGHVAKAQRNYPEALKHFQLAAEVQRRKVTKWGFWDDRQLLAQLVSFLCAGCCATGDLASAKLHGRECLSMLDEIYPPQLFPDGHDYHGFGWSLLARTHYNAGEYVEAFRAATRACRIESRVVSDYAMQGGPSAEVRLLARRGSLHLLSSAACRAEGTDEDHYQQVLNISGIVGRVLAHRRRLAAAEQNSEPFKQRLREYSDLRRELGHHSLEAAHGSQRSAAWLKEHVPAIDESERTLLAELNYPDGTVPWQVSWESIVKAMPEKSVVVDWFQYADHKQLPGETSYLAFVLSRDPPRVVRIPVGDVKPIDELVAQWRHQIDEERDDREVAAAFRKQVWQPVSDVIGEDVRTVFICGAGRLSAVPWAAIPGREPGKFLVHEYAMATLPSPTLLVDAGKKATTTKSVLAIGDVDYGRGQGDSQLTPLPGAQEELSAITAASNRIGVTINTLTGAEATVDAVIRRAGKASILHFATHGVARIPGAGEEAAAGDETGQRNPLALSGLALANANAPDTQATYLSSETLATLNLEHVDLIVASACESALGPTPQWEGAQGFQAAGHIAGARNVVASLWRIDDASTAAHMRQFYDQLLTSGKSPIEALHQTQLTVLANPRLIMQAGNDRGDFSDRGKLPNADRKINDFVPTKHWAAFVLSGPGTNHPPVNSPTAVSDKK